MTTRAVEPNFTGKTIWTGDSLGKRRESQCGV